MPQHFIPFRAQPSAGLFLILFGAGCIGIPVLFTYGTNADQQGRQDYLESMQITDRFPSELRSLRSPPEFPEGISNSGSYALPIDRNVTLRVTLDGVESVNGLSHVTFAKLRVNESPNAIDLVKNSSPSWGNRLVTSRSDQVAMRRTDASVTFDVHKYLNDQIRQNLHKYVTLTLDAEFTFPSQSGFGQFANSTQRTNRTFKFFIATEDELKKALELDNYKRVKQLYGDGSRTSWIWVFLFSVVGVFSAVVGFNLRYTALRNQRYDQGLIQADILVFLFCLFLTLLAMCGGVVYIASTDPPH
jgi:hypothetical protein